MHVYSHNPAAAYLIVGSILLVPGIIAAVIAKSYKFIWCISVIPLIMLSFFLMNQGLNKILSYIVLLIPVMLIPGAVIFNKRIANKGQRSDT
jgi:lysylphosphatidylglycerol synthetase-like protein (DUF2156 family)